MEFKVNLKDVQSLDSSEDGDFIHRNINDMLVFLGFSLETSRFQIISEDKSVCVPALGDVKNVSLDLPGVKLFARRQRYLRLQEVVASSTTYITYRDLLGSRCIRYSLASNSTIGLGNKVIGLDTAMDLFNSTIGLENKVIGLDTARDLFNMCEDSSVMLAFSKGYVVQSGPSYLIHPLFLYDLCLKKKK